MSFDHFTTGDNLEMPLPNRFFDGLVRNAIDFLKKSVDELEKSPKFSLILFYAAIELFFKARLLAEHWTLVISDLNKIQKKKGETVLSKFEGGDLNSVGLDKCIERLKETCGVHIPDRALTYFNHVRILRNKLLHFFHPDYSEIASLAIVVPEQLYAWYYLHKLLCDDWEDHFLHYQKDIEEAHELICGNWKYLEAKYKAVEPDIEHEKASGVVFTKCTICGYEAARFTDLHGIVCSNQCLVCHYQNNTIHIPCPECSNEIRIIEQGIGECNKCGFETDFEFLLSELAPHQDPKEDPVMAYCAECEHPEASIIPVGEYDEEGLCLNCNTLHAAKGNCHFCGELIAGKDLSPSYSHGCIFCEGSIGADDS